jgi:hypothetical protein
MTDGDIEGLAVVGAAEGDTEGLVNGEMDDATEGMIDGASEGLVVGAAEGDTEGINEGPPDGNTEGINEGAAEAATDGLAEGDKDGSAVGITEGDTDGSSEGMTEGAANELAVGGTVGGLVGLPVGCLVGRRAIGLAVGLPNNGVGMDGGVGLAVSSTSVSSAGKRKPGTSHRAGSNVSSSKTASSAALFRNSHRVGSIPLHHSSSETERPVYAAYITHAERNVP